VLPLRLSTNSGFKGHPRSNLSGGCRIMPCRCSTL
jgi:hypothetical protein